MINREDMLELTRRMTIKRNCFSRIAGAYMDEEGFVDGTFNTHFLKLSASDQTRNLAIAKTIPFSETNINLKEYQFTKEDEKPGGDIVNIGLHFFLKNVRPYAASCSEA